MALQLRQGHLQHFRQDQKTAPGQHNAKPAKG